MNVGRYMHADAVTVPSDASLSQAREVMEEHGYSLLLITGEGGVLDGFLTRAGLKDVKDWDLPVSRLSHPVKCSVSPDDTLEKAALIMLANRLVILPVVQDDRLAGVITQSELLKGLATGLGVGLEATRLTIKLRAGNDDLYAALDVLRKHGARIVSLVQGGRGEARSEIVIRVQEVEDKEKLRDALEAVLREIPCEN